MARRRKNFKQVYAATKDLGSAGDQILIGTFQPLDPSVGAAWFNNVQISLLLNDGDTDNGGIAAYLTTNTAWSDSDIITCRAGSLGDTLSLTARRRIADYYSDASRSDGAVSLWLEVTDLALGTVDVRYIAEYWGRFLKFNPA